MKSVSGINVKKIQIREHAIKRARERGHWSSKLKGEHIAGNIRSLLTRAHRICESVDEEGRPSVLFAIDRYEIHLTPDLDEVITIIKQDHVTYPPIKNKLLDLHKKELRKLERSEKARCKRLESLMFDCNIEIAELQRRIFRTRSQSVKQACEARINAINKSIQEYKNEIKSIQDEKRRVSRSLVAVI